MKLYKIYLLSKNKLYAITNNKKYLKRFLLERNPKLFKVIIEEYDNDECISILKENPSLNLNIVPLENKNGNFEIIGTNREDNILEYVCEQMVESCEYFKLYFTKNFYFKKDYSELLDSLCTISKNINYHPIIQINIVKLFYYLFKDTFIDLNQFEYNDIESGDIDEFMAKYKIHY